MRRSVRFRPLRHSPAWLLAIGLFAMALQAMGGSGLMLRHAGGGLQMEICTGKGMLRAGSTTSLRGLVDAAGDEIDCCELTSFTTGPGLTSSPRALAVLESASGARLAARLVEVPTFVDWALPSPRGPPLLG